MLFWKWASGKLISREIVNALYGAIRLMKFDVAGRSYFNYTVEGFWRSFVAAILAFPIFLALTFVHVWSFEGPIFQEVQLVVLRYATGWLVYPLVVLVLVKVLNRTANYVAYIITINWLAVPQWALACAVGALGHATGPDIGNLLAVFLLMLLVYYDFFVTRIVLDLTTGRAAMVVLIGMLVAMVLDITILGT